MMNRKDAIASFAVNSWINGDRVIWPGADLTDVNLSSANLYGADLRYATLRWANLRRCDLRKCDLRWADPTGANLDYADLDGAKILFGHRTLMLVEVVHDAAEMSKEVVR